MRIALTWLLLCCALFSQIPVPGPIIGTSGGGGGGGGGGTVTVVGSGSVASTALVTGGGGTAIQTPSTTATLTSLGLLSLPAGGGLVVTPSATMAAGELMIRAGDPKASFASDIQSGWDDAGSIFAILNEPNKVVSLRAFGQTNVANAYNMVASFRGLCNASSGTTPVCGGAESDLFVQTSGTAAMTYAVAHWVDLNLNATGSAAITNAIGLFWDGYTIAGNAPTNLYGLYMADIAGGTNNYPLAIIGTSGVNLINPVTLFGQSVGFAAGTTTASSIYLAPGAARTTGPVEGDFWWVDASNAMGGYNGTAAFLVPQTSAAYGTDNRLIRTDGTGVGTQVSAITVDDSGNLSTAGSATFGSGGSNAGSIVVGQGTAPSVGTNSVTVYADTSVTAYKTRLPNAAGTGFFLGTNTSNDVVQTIVGFTGTDNVVRATSPTITTPTFSGAMTLPDNVRQTFNPGTNAAGLNVGSQTANPDTPSNGDIFYDSDDNLLRARINGAWVSLGSGGSAVNRQITLVTSDVSTTGTKSCSVVEVAGTIVAAHLVSNALPTGANLVVDVKKIGFTSYTGTGSSTSITASAIPTIATSDSNPRYEDTTLTGWTTSVSANDVVCVSISTAPTGGATWAALSLEIQ